MSKRKPARTIKARSASEIRSKPAGSGQPKEGANSKQAWVLALLCGPSGATIATVTPAHAAAWLRLCPSQRRPRHTGATGLARPQEHPSQGALQRTCAGSI